MSEDYLIRNCSPTLAGIKTGSMFTCPYTSKDELYLSIRQLNLRLVPRGLRLVPLRCTEQKALLYLYRPSRLRSDLADETARELLLRSGYGCESCEKCLSDLAKRLRSHAEFPHEIGLFLGYPPEDVEGFISNSARNCKCVGCWKVYGDETAAQKRFDQYKKCTRIYQELWQKGRSIEKLTVNG